MIRHTIVEVYKAGGVVPSLDEIADRASMSVEGVKQALSAEPPLEKVLGLTPSQALHLIDGFRTEKIFSQKIVDTLNAYAEVRRRLDEAWDFPKP